MWITCWTTWVIFNIWSWARLHVVRHASRGYFFFQRFCSIDRICRHVWWWARLHVSRRGVSEYLFFWKIGRIHLSWWWVSRNVIERGVLVHLFYCMFCRISHICSWVRRYVIGHGDWMHLFGRILCFTCHTGRCSSSPRAWSCALSSNIIGVTWNHISRTATDVLGLGVSSYV